MTYRLHDRKTVPMARAMGTAIFAQLCCLLLLFVTLPAQAEPNFAVNQGMKCMNCHANPSGGGLRNEYGNLWAKLNLAEKQVETDGDAWTGRVSRHFAIGGNLRSSASVVDTPSQDSDQQFALDEIRAYLQFDPIPNRLSIHIDQRLAPGAGQNQETYVRYMAEARNWYLKAGRMYLPYGWRLEDDSAFIRTTPGISFNTPDSGIEMGWELDSWSLQAAVSNGTAGGPETDSGKQLSLRAEHIRPGWRVGASVNSNDTDLGTRNMQNIFAGLRTGPVSWLAEIDHIWDETFVGTPRTQWVGLLEANWWMRKGHNLKVTAEHLDPDANVDDDERQRYSLLWEYSPIQFMQVRVGTRMYDGDPAIDTHNRTQVFAEWHGFF